MNKQKINEVVKNMQENNLDYLLISEPSSIDYLINYVNNPGERMYVLMLGANGDHCLFFNKLFFVENDLGIEIVWHSDTDEPTASIASKMTGAKTVGVDKHWSAHFLLSLMEKMPNTKFVNGSKCVDYVRMVKDTEEQELMIEASKINDKAVDEVIKLVGTGLSEKQIADKLEDIYKQLGASGNSFEPIVAFGANGANPHHENDDSQLKPGDSVIIDMGCKYHGYCSDMTRTVFYKSAPQKAKEIFNIVLEANKRAIAMVKPGVRFCDIDNAAREYITEKGYGKYFTHRTGHSIGIETHDMGDVSAINTDILKPGMIFSVEPGIYLPGEFGVRIEDLVLVTEDGCEILNKYNKELNIIK